MNNKKMFIERYGLDLYNTFIYWLREDAVAEYGMGSLWFFVKTGNKNRKRALSRVLYKHATSSLCVVTLKNFKTREDLVEHIYKNRNELGFFFDKKGTLNKLWRTK